jgi:hypothetical protein
MARLSSPSCARSSHSPGWWTLADGIESESLIVVLDYVADQLGVSPDVHLFKNACAVGTHREARGVSSSRCFTDIRDNSPRDRTPAVRPIDLSCHSRWP